MKLIQMKCFKFDIIKKFLNLMTDHGVKENFVARMFNS